MKIRVNNEDFLLEAFMIKLNQKVYGERSTKNAEYLI